MISKTTEVRLARPGDASGIARVEVETWRDAYPTLVPAAYLVGRLDIRRAAARWAARIGAGAQAILVAEAAVAGRPIVGYVTWGGSRIAAAPTSTRHAAAKVGEIYELYVSPAARERGIGRRLARGAAERLLGAGMAAMVVEVLEGNPSRWFYEAVGGRLAARGRHAFAGTTLPSVVYAWDDLAAFVGADGDGVP